MADIVGASNTAHCVPVNRSFQGTLQVEVGHELFQLRFIVWHP